MGVGHVVDLAVVIGWVSISGTCTVVVHKFACRMRHCSVAGVTVCFPSLKDECGTASMVMCGLRLLKFKHRLEDDTVASIMCSASCAVTIVGSSSITTTQQQLAGPGGGGAAAAHAVAGA